MPYLLMNEFIITLSEKLIRLKGVYLSFIVNEPMNENTFHSTSFSRIH